MRRLAITSTAALAFALPATAQEDEDPGMSLIERGARMFMEGMLKEMEPAIDQFESLGPMFRDFAKEMGPAFGELMSQIKDWSAYHPPEILPNGDIIIRRKQDAPPLERPEGDGSIEL